MPAGLVGALVGAIGRKVGQQGRVNKEDLVKILEGKHLKFVLADVSGWELTCLCVSVSLVRLY